MPSHPFLVVLDLSLLPDDVAEEAALAGARRVEEASEGLWRAVEGL